MAQGEIVLVEAEKVAEFVEVGGADFLGENPGVGLRQIPKVLEIENDPRRRIGGGGVGLQPAGALKQTQEIRLEPLVQDGRIRNVLVQRDDGFRGGTKLGGQAGTDALDARRSQLV